MYGATISESPAPYLGRLYIRPGRCTAPAILGVVDHGSRAYELSGAVHRLGLYWTQPKRGAKFLKEKMFHQAVLGLAPYTSRLHIGAAPTTAPRLLS